MPEPVSQQATLLVAQLGGWPEARAGRVTVGPGETSWREAVGLSTPGDRAQLTLGLPPVPHPALLAGEGRRRLIDYYDRHAGHPPAESDPATLERSLVYIGDLGVKKILVGVLVALPSAVVDFLTRGIWIIGVGRETGGWYDTAPPLPSLGAEDEALRLIVLSGHRDDGALASLVAHEVAHCWIEAAPRAADVVAPAARLDNMTTLVRLATEFRVPLPWGTFTPTAQAEHRAAALATAWGYPADASVCARGAVRILTEEIAHRLAIERAARPEEEK